MADKTLLIVTEDAELADSIGTACKAHYESVAESWGELADDDADLQAQLTDLQPSALVFVSPLWPEGPAGGAENDHRQALDFLEQLYRVCHAAVPVITRQPGGRVAGVLWRDLYGGAGAGTSLSTTAMAAASAFVRTLAMELAKGGATANGVVTVPPQTPYSKAHAAERMERQRGFAFLDRAIEAADIAYALAFLLSPMAQVVTGALINVDAGASLGQQQI